MRTVHHVWDDIDSELLAWKRAGRLAPMEREQNDTENKWLTFSNDDFMGDELDGIEYRQTIVEPQSTDSATPKEFDAKRQERIDHYHSLAMQGVPLFA